MKIFGLRIVKEKDYEKLQSTCDSAVRDLREEKYKSEELQARLDAIEKGDCCTGEYCKRCNDFGGTRPAYVGLGIVEQVPICLKNVPCKGFERKTSSC